MQKLLPTALLVLAPINLLLAWIPDEPQSVTQVSPKQGFPKQASPKQASPKQASPGEAPPKQAARSQPIELGEVVWQRDFAKATEAAKRSEKPMLVLFQEVPG